MKEPLAKITQQQGPSNIKDQAATHIRTSLKFNEPVYFNANDSLQFETSDNGTSSSASSMESFIERHFEKIEKDNSGTPKSEISKKQAEINYNVMINKLQVGISKMVQRKTR